MLAVNGRVEGKARPMEIPVTQNWTFCPRGGPTNSLASGGGGDFFLFTFLTRGSQGSPVRSTGFRFLVLCDSLEGWVGVGSERRFKTVGTYIHHVDVWQKTQLL